MSQPNGQNIGAFEDPLPLPALDQTGVVEHAGAQTWYGTVGKGSPVVLLHGALGNSGDWGNQIPSLYAAGFQVILIDSRGRGRSTRGTEPLGYESLAAEVIVVLDALKIERAAVAGWSDGMIIGLILAMRWPERITRIFAFSANMDMTGVNPEPISSPGLSKAFQRAKSDYERLSSTPTEFKTMAAAMDQMMTSEPNYTAEEIARISAPVAIVRAEYDEFIKPEHLEYLARTIPGASLITLTGVSHFAPWQDPGAFNRRLMAFLQ